MAIASALKRILPRISLSAVFLLFFCVAVGLTVDPNPIDALQPIIATGMVVGLIQQIQQLLHARRSVSDDVRSSFALWFAISWRAILTAVMTICVVGQILISHDLWHEPTGKDLIVYRPTIDVVVQLCMIAVLSDSVRRWRSHISLRPARFSRIAAKWMLGLALIVLMLPDIGMMYYLVHIATAGIEFAQPLRLQRHGVFPDQYQHGFRLFWMTIGVVISLSLAAVFLVVQNIEWRSRRARLLLGIGFATTLLLAASFCVWYYGTEFRRISPDLAAAGFPGTWLDWVDTAVITGILVTAGAYRLTRHHEPQILYSQNLSENSVAPAFHESVPGLTLLGIAAIVDAISWVRGIIKFTSTPGPATIWESIVALLRYPYFYLSFAVLILSIQLCWRRWRRRNDSVGWEVMAIDRAWFFWNWVRLAMLAIVGLPTLSAYSFIYWLGPWYLYGPK